MAVNLQLFGLAAGFINELIRTGQYRPLSDAQINFLVGKGCWIINAELRQAPLGPVLSESPGDSNVMAGQGVSDLNRVQQYMDAYPWGRFSVDVGGPDSFGQDVYIGTNDIIRMRDAFITLWGTVNRPYYWADQTTTVLPPQFVNYGTVWP
jgi:hypothetical protein